MKAEGILPTVGSKFDELTGLYNREAFLKETVTLLGARYDVNYCIVCMDISCFKIINDLFHMDTGNLILQSAAFAFQAKNSELSRLSRIWTSEFKICT